MSHLMDQFSRSTLKAWTTDARARTLDLVRDLSDKQFRVRLLRTINPFLWEIGHVAYFQEYWVLRHAAGRPPIRPDGDRLYDSVKIAHNTPWNLPLPSRAETIHYILEVRDRVLNYIFNSSFDPSRDAYFVLLSEFHEDMHDEAFFITRQTLGYPFPTALGRTDAPLVETSAAGDLFIPAVEPAAGCRPNSNGKSPRVTAAAIRCLAACGNGRRATSFLMRAFPKILTKSTRARGFVPTRRCGEAPSRRVRA